jgi:tetratricopeptide (TPR) repeat protein
MMKNYTFKTCIILLMSIIYQPLFAQGNKTLLTADSLFTAQNWKAAKTYYIAYLGDTSSNSIAWNRLGFCNHNLGMYTEAVKDYNKALATNPIPPVKSVILGRMAKTYAVLNKPDEAADNLVKATTIGYNSLPDLDSAADFKNLRSSAKLKEIRQQLFEIIYPCTKEPHNHDFDFWIGDWNCYNTDTKTFVGNSHVESMAGGCALLENYTSTQAYVGKSFNYYNPKADKWEQDWVGSGGASDRQKYNSGEYKNGAMHFTYETVNAKGEKQTGNFIFYNMGKDTVRQYQDISNDGGKTVTVSYDITYIRKKA